VGAESTCMSVCAAKESEEVAESARMREGIECSGYEYEECEQQQMPHHLNSTSHEIAAAVY
jgi:hypothetical protein